MRARQRETREKSKSVSFESPLPFPKPANVNLEKILANLKEQVARKAYGRLKAHQNY